MRTVSDHIALLQDDVDPENATEEEAGDAANLLI